MEKFKLLLEQAQKLNEQTIDEQFGIPSPDDVLRGVGKLLKKPFQRSSGDRNQQTPHTTHTTTPQRQTNSDVTTTSKSRPGFQYYQLNDNKLPNPLFIKYNLQNANVEFIGENDFKRMS